MLDDAIGLFVNTLVMRTDTSGDPSFDELLGRVRETALTAHAHQDVPFEHLVEVLNPVRSANRHPLFQVALVLQNTPEAGLTLAGVDVTLEPAGSGTSRFDLFFSVTERPAPPGAPTGSSGGVRGTVEYSTDLFDRRTVEAIVARWIRLLEEVSADPARRIGEADLLTSAERTQLLGAAGDPIPPSVVPALFERRAASEPGAPAVLSESGVLTYEELNGRANRLAHLLISRGSDRSRPSHWPFPAPRTWSWRCSPFSRRGRPTSRSTSATRPSAWRSCSATPGRRCCSHLVSAAPGYRAPTICPR